MPTMPVTAAGWRMEPPVSVPVAARAHMRRDRRRRTARRSARHEIARCEPLRAPRADDRPEIARLVRRAHGEFVHVGLAEHHRARIPQILRDGGFVRRHEIVERMWLPAVVRTPLVQNRSLIASGMPSSARASPLAMRASEASAIANARSGVSVTKAFSVRAGLDRFDECAASVRARKSSSRRRASRASASVKSVGLAGRHHSTTLGTTKKLSSACGALAVIARRIAARRHLVLAHFQLLLDHAGHGRDALDVHFFELLHPGQNLVQLIDHGLHPLLFQRRGGRAGRCAGRCPYRRTWAFMC